MKKPITIGIDEVGRGALAGPVVLSAVLLRGPVRWWRPELGRIRDCKKLTPLRREAWFRYLATHPRLTWRLTRVSPAVIDRINIARAANRGARRLVHYLAPLRGKYRVLLDGGLILPQTLPHRTIVKGDERVPLIAAASIIAKVSRDRLMTRLGRKFPDYGFPIHKGYGTLFHRRMIRRHGPSAVHRKTFSF